MRRKKPAIFVYPNLKTMSEIFAKFFLIRVEEIKKRNLDSGKKKTVVALPGGRTASQLFNGISDCVSQERIESVMKGCDLWMSDERFVEENSAQRNERSLKSFIDTVGKSANYFQLPYGSDNLNDRVSEINDKFASNYKDIDRVFDIVMVGVGEDGHIASLFPGVTYSTASSPFAAVENSPKEPSKRITLTIEMIRSANEVWIITSGEEKRDILSEAFKALETDQDCLSSDIHVNNMDLPVSKAIGIYRTIWFLDRDAARKINP